MIARHSSGAGVCPFGSSLRSPHHRLKPTVPPLPCRGWHVPQGQTSALAGLSTSLAGFPAAAGVIPAFAEKRLIRKSSGQPSQRSRALCPVSQKDGHRLRFRPFSCLVSFISGHRLHLAGMLVPLLILFTVASCGRPAFYEQFIKAEDAHDGVYEFAIPSGIILPSGTSAVQATPPSVEPSAAPASPAALAASAVPSPTFDISIYTAPLEKALQLEISWLELPSGDLSHFSPEMPQVPFENGGPGAKMPQNAADTTKKDTTCSNNGVFCDRSLPDPQTIHQTIHKENVWFPAGEHRALYRSGVALGNVPEPCTSQGGAGTSAAMQTTIAASTPVATSPATSRSTTPAPRIILRIEPINPPESFRGLGIICKLNDGTR